MSDTGKMRLDSPIGDTVVITVDGQRHGPFCGDRWCHGKCKLPAVYAIREGERYFLRGSMTACGPMMQPTNQHGSGEVIDLATLLTPEQVDYLFRRWWM